MRPDSLYSHSDQQTQWQTSLSEAPSATGWGGRLADVMAAQAGGNFPVITSTAGVTLLRHRRDDAAARHPGNGQLRAGRLQRQAPRRTRASRRCRRCSGSIAATRSSRRPRDITQQAIALSATVNPILANAELGRRRRSSPGRIPRIAQQLLAVAKMIEARAATGSRRQIFFVSLGGFDTHNNELATQQNLLGQLVAGAEGLPRCDRRARRRAAR